MNNNNRIKDQNSNIKDETSEAPAEEKTPEQDENTKAHNEAAEPTNQSSVLTSQLSDNSQSVARLAKASAKRVSSSDEPTSENRLASRSEQQKTDNSNPNAKWYVIHTYSGHENKVAHTLKQRIESEHLGKKILEILVPMQDKIEIKSGKKVNVKEKIFPGYILVKMVLDDTSWLAVRTTQGVTSFVGMGNKPTPISDAEVQTIVKFTQTETPMYKQVFTVNDTVKIVDGPFADFIGKIDSVDEEKGKVRVLVSIFGRETPVELDFLQIKKI